MATRNTIFEEHLKEWLNAKGNRPKRKEITDHVCFVAKVHPKSVPRGFLRAQMRDASSTHRPGRKTVYGPDVTAALKVVWEISGESCAENLHPMVSEYITILKRDQMWKQPSSSTEQLLCMSLGTMKKRVAAFRRMSFPTHGKSTTSPSAIHSVVPVRSGPWHDAPAGTMQVDTVAHCGHSVAGDYVFTVNATDVVTLWGVRRAQWNKGQTATIESMETMDNAMPFPVLEWHPDSGSEFINWLCVDWCSERNQILSRSRPNHKNDNCFVEERNGHVVRRFVGYARLDHPDIVCALNDLYDVLTPYLNHFIASKRTVSKERVGAKWKVTRERIALTPYQRVLLRTDVTDEVKDLLRATHATLNPQVLKQEIDRRTKTLFTLLKRHEIPLREEGSR